MKKKLIGLSSLVGFAPFVVLAQSTTIQSTIGVIGNIFATLIPVLIVLGVVYFVWGVVQYVISSEEEAKQKGKMRMIYGIIGLVVIVAMWGLVAIVQRTFDLDSPSNVEVDLIPNFR